VHETRPAFGIKATKKAKLLYVLKVFLETTRLETNPRLTLTAKLLGSTVNTL
jgi:hypothetical protein